MNGAIEWAIFLALAITAVGMAAGMLLTMSMYRAGLALMSSFVALAGLFILLDADLMAAIQVMMNVGGMLVMILFMVMIMMDPGGEMMWDMKRQMNLRGPGAFSMSMPRGEPPTNDHEPRSRTRNETYTCPMHPEVKQQGPGKCPKCGMDLVPAENKRSMASKHKEHKEMKSDAEHGGSENMMGMSPRQHQQMMVDMAMSTAQLPWAIAVGAASALVLVVLFMRTPWQLSATGPSQDAASAVGELLLSRYMIGFEGAAFLILAGMVGAVIFGKRERGFTSPKPPAESRSHAETYTCPMHPEVREPEPGQCPKCGMDLVPAGAQP
jgi:NADH:ubiquinone oxidoreductase subunit 6 (subunit J)